MYACQSCGWASAKPYRMCQSCGAWGAMIPVIAVPPGSEGELFFAESPGGARRLVDLREEVKLESCGLALLDEALGGWMGGYTILLAGAPGTGKTSLALKLADAAARDVLIASGEEAEGQMAAARDKLRIRGGRIAFQHAQELDAILAAAGASGAGILILNSLNTTSTTGAKGSPGGVRQIVAVTRQVCRWTRAHPATMSLLLGHLTWGGRGAPAHSHGPRTIEHEVEAVLYLTLSAQGQRRLEVRKARPPFRGRVASYPVPDWA